MHVEGPVENYCTDVQYTSHGATRKPPEIIEVLAEVLYKTLGEADPTAFMQDYTLEHPLTIDGNFHFRALAALLLVNLNAQFGRMPSLLDQIQPKKT